MFEALRKMIFPIIIIVLVFFVAMIVLQWGMGMSGGSGDYREANLAAVINGEEIDWTTYNRIYNNLYRAEAEEHEDEVPEERERELHLDAWRQLLSDRLLAQEMAKYNIVVTDEELYAYLRFSPPPELQAAPAFQTDGQFDYQKYVAALADPQASAFWSRMEPHFRNDLRRMKTQEIILSTALVTEEEVKGAFLEATEKVKVGVVNVPYKIYSRPPPQPTEEQLREYFEGHQEAFTLGKRASLNIAMVEKEPAPYDWEISYNRIQSLYDSVKNGADFAEMAQRHSDDRTAEAGGDLGWFAKGQMVAEFDRMAFNLSEGDLSQPFRTQYGWHILLHHGFKEEEDARRDHEGEIVRKAHCSHILIKPDISQETRETLSGRAVEYREAAQREGFFKAAEELKIEVKQTSFFFYGGNIQYLGKDAKAGMFAFEEEPGAISEVLENSSAFYVVQVAERRPEGQAMFEEAEEKVRMEWVRVTVQNLCRDTAWAIYEDIQAGTSWDKAAAKYGLEYVETDLIDRNARMTELELSRDPIAIGAAFSLTEVGQISKPIDYDRGTVIYKLIERTTADMAEFTSKRDSIATTLLSRKQQGLYTRWFENLVATSDIVNNVQARLEEDTLSLP